MGRLTNAGVGTNSYEYGFAPTGGCGALTTAGANTNRTSVTVNGGTPVTYCYNHADRLSSTSDASIGSPVYDAHGNTTAMGTQALSYDGDNRHMATVEGTDTLTYTRDVTGRITTRNDAGVITTYGYSGPGDSPSSITSGLSTQRTYGLIGGATLNKGGTETWSYPNIHGDVMARAGSTGTKIGTTHTYDPYGAALGAIPDTNPGDFDYGWLGSHQRPTEHSGSITTIEMGARPYVGSLGRFLSVDPIEGGSANDYEYTAGDPINWDDIAGLCRTIHQGSHVRDFLTADVCAPMGFPYQPVVVTTKNGLFSGDPAGDCSHIRDRRSYYNFHTACQVHDYGYDLLRYFGYGGDERKAVDSLLRQLVYSDCSNRGFGARQACRTVARIVTVGVQANSYREVYEAPRGAI